MWPEIVGATNVRAYFCVNSFRYFNFSSKFAFKFAHSHTFLITSHFSGDNLPLSWLPLNVSCDSCFYFVHGHQTAVDNVPSVQSEHHMICMQHIDSTIDSLLICTTETVIPCSDLFANVLHRNAPQTASRTAKWM